MSSSPTVVQTFQPPQHHAFIPITLGALGSTQVSLNCPFPVKEVRINVAYQIAFDASALCVVTMPTLVPDGQIVASLNSLVQVIVGTGHFYSDSFRNNNAIHYSFREPQFINGSYPITFALVAGIGALVGNGIAQLHVEFLG